MVELTGVGAEFKDKRVNKIISKKGHSDCEIYYSPIKVSYLYFIILSFPILFFGSQFGIISWLVSNYLAVFGYFIMMYLLSSYLNHSIALSKTDLLIINPNFPFNRFNSYKYEEIERIRIGKNSLLNFGILFGVFGRNFIEVYTGDKIKRYYCISLDIDAFDENMTKLTLDDLHADLRARSIRVEFQL